MNEIWEPTKTGGFRRRQRVAQRQSTNVTRWRSVVAKPPPLTIAWHERLGLPECIYLIRSSIVTPIGSIRHHRWLGPDDSRAVHDHPWWFITFVYRGSYKDYREDGTFEVLTAPTIRFRRSSHRHYVVPGPNGASTILITGPKKRFWGFYPNGKFMRHTKYFHEHGHHPCQ